MDPLGVELGAAGNHEFDRGTAELLRLQDGGCDAAKRCFGGARMRYVAANVIDNATGGPILPPYQVRTVDDVRIGFIGLTLRDTPTIVRPSGVAGLTFLDEAPAINRYAGELQAQGVNAIVVLIHQGGDGSVDGGPITGAEINRIANGIDPAVRVIVSGHTHRGYQGSIGDRLVTQAIAITRESNAAGESALGNLIADAHRRAMRAQIAFTNPGGIRDDLPAGPISWGRLFAIQPFANDLVRMTLTGMQIERLLNQQWRDPGFVRILKTSGVRYTWDGDDPNQRVRPADVFLADGMPLRPEERYTVTVNGFLTTGGDGFTVFTEGEDRETGPTDLDALVSYVETRPQPISARVEGRIEQLGAAVLLPARPAISGARHCLRMMSGALVPHIWVVFGLFLGPQPV